MVNLDYRRKKKLQIYAVALLLLVCCCLFVACNKNDNVYDVSGANIPEPTHFMAKFMLILNDGIGNFGWTVVVFTIILRLILSPLDLWQKIVARKNSKAMERMKPQLESMQAKYKNDKERYQKEQMALYKKEKYSMMGACLPTIITMVVFFIVFAGFRQMVGFQYALDYKNSYNVYEQSMTRQIEDVYGKGATIEDIPKVGEEGEKGAEFLIQAKENAQNEVKESYFSDEQTGKRSWLWIKNIFVPDTWKQAVPEFTTVTGQSGFATAKLTGVTPDEYNTVMAKVLGTGGWAKDGKFNGWMLLPLFSVLLSFVSSKLLSKAQGTPPPQIPKGDGEDKGNQMQSSMKMMQYMMPLMMGVFGLLYSGAFALYMFVSSFAAITFQLGFNLVAKIVDNVRDKKTGTLAYKK